MIYLHPLIYVSSGSGKKRVRERERAFHIQELENKKRGARTPARRLMIAKKFLCRLLACLLACLLQQQLVIITNHYYPYIEKNQST